MKYKYTEVLKHNYKRIIQVVIVLIFLAIMLIVANNQKEEHIEFQADTRIEDLNNTINKMKNNINSLESDYTYDTSEYTGTIPPFTYTADIINIDIENNSIYGITSNKDTYSGLMRYDFSLTDINISNIELYNTYNITCRPLIRDTKDNAKITPYVEVISIEKATQEDKDALDKSKYELSRYIEFKLKYELKTLDETIEAANKEFYKWTDDDIIDFQEWILSRGYTEDTDVVSNVKTIEQLKDEQ